jgi:hypothetical protein
MRRILIACLLVSFAVSVSAQDLPFHGKWKLNPARSDFRGLSFTVAAGKAPGELTFSQYGQSYTFKVDGKDYPATMGTTARWRQIDPNTWEAVISMKGQPLTTLTMAMESDGRRMILKGRGKRPDGQEHNEDVVFQRVAARRDLVGKWTSTKADITTPVTLALTANGADGVTYAIPEFGMTCKLKFDGSDQRCTGPAEAPGHTLSAVRAGKAALRITEKMNGKTLIVSTLSPSPDGKTLTEFGKTADGEAFKAVYEKQ